MSAAALILSALALVAGVAWIGLLYGRRASLAEPGARGAAAIAAGTVAALAAAGVVAVVIAGNAASSTVKGRHGEIELSASEQRGQRLFGSTCARCHRLAAARSAGDVGPDLDLIQPPPARTLRTIEHGSVGYTAIMPPKLLRGRDARDVAAYIAKVARR